MVDAKDMIEILTAPEPQLAALVGLIIACIFWAEVFLREEIKEKIASLILRESKDVSLADWPALFLDLFSSIFGEKTWRIRFFCASFLSSLLSVTLLTIVWLLFSDSLGDYTSSLELFLTTLSIVFGEMLLTGIFLNLIPDVASLVQSRYIIQCMVDKPWTVVLLLVAVDFVLTTIIILVAFLTYSSIVFGSLTASVELIWLSLPNMLSMDDTLSWAAIPGLAGVFVYSTYLTSVWVWLYALSLFSAAMLFRARRLRSVFFRIWSEEKLKQHPFSFLGMLIFSIAVVLGVGRYIVQTLLTMES